MLNTLRVALANNLNISHKHVWTELFFDLWTYFDMIVIGFFSCYTDGLNAMDNVVCYRRMLSSCIALKNFRIIFSDFMISSTRCFFIWSSAKFSMTCWNKTCPTNSAVLINWVQLHLNWFTAAVKSLQFERLFSLTAACSYFTFLQ